MADMLIAGTLALDSIKTPFGEVQNALGGSAMYASLAANFFVKPAVCSIIGKDFPQEYLQMLKSKGIDCQAISVADKTFRWSGMYEYDMNEAKTLKTELNALMEFNPIIPSALKNTPFVFLGNLDPSIQMQIVEQLDSPKKIMIDTMNFWISSKKSELKKAISKADIFVLNDGEARMLFETSNLVQAAKAAEKLGPKTVIIKKGEHGSLLFHNDEFFASPGYPLEDIKDPTGCGDCFGGGFLGYLASHNNGIDNIRRAVVHGSIIASYNAEGMASEKLVKLTKEDIDKRFNNYQKLVQF